MKRAWVYILKCADNSYYVGYTTNIERRIKQHNSDSYPNSYVNTRRPAILIYKKEFKSIYEAKLAEKQLKGWGRKKKEALARGAFDLLHKLSECRNRSHYKYRASSSLSAD